jgi:hypothetical protein
MRATWRDPDDLTPGARRAPREITAWRSYCPLRKMSGHPNSGITAAHIMAADKFREVCDVAVMGYTAARPLIFVGLNAAPRFGMGADAVAQMRAVREMRRAVRLFHPPQLLMIEAVILRNMTLRQWCESRVPRIATPRLEKVKLLVILERLVQHFDSDVADDLARGRRLPP